MRRSAHGRKRGVVLSIALLLATGVAAHADALPARTDRLVGLARVSFTGEEVRHVDGRQLQRVGIQPDVVVRPTLAGVRAGKDEVLERALAYLATGK
jgi:hypothetical protein